jgi:hypothetical protein
MVSHESPLSDSQPMLEGFYPIEGIDVPINPATQAEIQAQMVAAGERRGHVESSRSPAYDDLGGGTSDSATTELPRAPQIKRKLRPIGHVRDVEPRDSDLDPYWSSPTPEPTAEHKAALERNMPLARAMVAQATAAARQERRSRPT